MKWENDKNTITQGDEMKWENDKTWENSSYNENTSPIIMDAIAAISGEETGSVQHIWENGYTKKHNTQELNELLLDYINSYGWNAATDDDDIFFGGDVFCRLQADNKYHIIG